MFGELQKQYDLLISHHLNEQDFGGALGLIEKMDVDKQADVLYKYCHLLMRHQPERTIKQLHELEVKHRQPIDYSKLIAGLMNVPKDKRDSAINYLVGLQI